MAQKPTYEELEQRVEELKKETFERKRAEEALLESEKNLKAVLYTSPVGIGLVVNRKMNWANDTVYHMVGYDQDSLLGQGVRIFYPNDKEFMRVGKELYDGIKESGTGQMETRWVRKDGTVFDCMLRGSSLDPSDPSKGQIVTVTDITERKRAEEKCAQQHDQLLALCDGMDEGIYVADPETKELLYLNRAAKEIWGNRIGETCHKILQNRDSPCPFCSNDEIFGKNIGKTYFWEYQNEVNRKWYRCIDRALRWPNEKMVRFELAIDITDRKQMEEALQEKTTHLEEVNVALKVLLNQRDKDIKEFGENVILNIKELINPYIEKIKTSGLTRSQETFIEIIESNLTSIISPFIGKVSSRYYGLTPMEIRVASLVKDGKTNKEIANLLNLSISTILTHRYHLRNKLGLQNKKINLRTHLLSFQ
ncbi:MAG: PAS domain S-box protein [Thermodesulfobacteriota bacterium]|nr:PAS domain S-box protein [Thermodesulfobacteriota bacterium]